MSNYNRYPKPQVESFTITLNIENSRISSKDLRAYLYHLEKLVDSINQTVIFHNNDMGFDSVSIDVLAIEQGSFRLPLSINKLLTSKRIGKIKKITENPTASIIIGGIVLNLLFSGVHPGPYDVPGIKNEHFLENINTAKAVKEIAKLTIDNDSIRDLVVTYETPDGKVEEVISKEILGKTKAVMDNAIEENERPHFLEDETLQIISPGLGDDPELLWKFKFNNKIIEAEMRDRTYLHKINNGDISFHYGDKIQVDMMVEGRGKDKKYYIIRVLEANSQNKSKI